METRPVQTPDGVRLHSFRYPAPGDKTVMWLHGAFEHSGRYLRVIEALAAHGFASVGFDFRGHGRSGGRRVFVRDYSEYIIDTATVCNAWGLADFWLAGHSMGGLVALRAVQTQAIAPAGIILSAPFLGMKVAVPAWKRTLSRLVVALAPQVALPNEVQSRLLTHDAALARAYDDDPLVTKTATAGWFEATLRAQRQALAAAEILRTPVHLLLAGDDRIVDNAAAQQLYDRLNPAARGERRVFEGFYHEILNEIEYERVHQTLLALLPHA